LIPGKVVERVVDVCYTADMAYQREEHRVHLIVYHLIWCPKRRKPVLTGEIATDCRALIQKKCNDLGWHVEELAIQPDHVHLFVRVWPTISVSEVLKDVQGVTSHELRQKYPQPRKLPSLWTRSYFASTAGNVSQERIRLYIEAQKGF
jgi:putative transposase